MRLSDDLALVQTVDFFTPIVDDPATYGAIAAANALSDIYAMGGRPLCALSIAAFPDRDFPAEWAAAILRGGQDKLAEAGCLLLGGHSVRDEEIKFGYAVTGLVHPDRLITNAGGRVGDEVVLTKPLGTGVMGTALKAGRAPAALVAAAIEAMVSLNASAADAALRHGVRGGTDVTGFGLAGHAVALARESGVTLTLRGDDLPLLPGAREIAATSLSGGLRANRSTFGPHVHLDPGLDAAVATVLFDPQTSGGLLLLVPPGELDGLLAEVPGARHVGRAVTAQTARLRVE